MNPSPPGSQEVVRKNMRTRVDVFRALVEAHIELSPETEGAAMPAFFETKGSEASEVTKIIAVVRTRISNKPQRTQISNKPQLTQRGTVEGKA